MSTVYVYSAVPPNSKETIKEYGLLSGVEVAKNKEILKLARPTKKSREDFVKKVETTAASDRPYSVLGPSVFFTLPDESKVTDKHFIKAWGLAPVRINLSKLMKDYPETMIWGAELLPFKHKWGKLSDEAFDRKIEQEYGLTFEEFLEERSHELTLADVRKYSKMQPETLWSNYERQHIGKYYAANVPHAFIITPMGYIPYAYVELMNPRENPIPISQKSTNYKTMILRKAVDLPADLRGMYFSYKILPDLSGKDIRGCVFYKCNPKIDSDECIQVEPIEDLVTYNKTLNLKNANLEGANLEGAYLEGTNLENAYLEEANLKRANLTGAGLAGVSLLGANLEG